MGRPRKFKVITFKVWDDDLLYFMIEDFEKKYGNRKKSEWIRSTMRDLQTNGKAQDFADIQEYKKFKKLAAKYMEAKVKKARVLREKGIDPDELI